MAKTARNTIKTWFETHDYPTQDQFWNWLDSFWHLDDDIEMANITGLVDALQAKADAISIKTPIVPNAGTDHVLIPAGTLVDKIVILEPGTINFIMGTTVGGNDLIDGDEVTVQSVIAHDHYYQIATTIYFTGITDSTQIIIYRR